ncbi:uncharacterized protein [Dendropsophus ebraccatus]|uniref:uncharacterized protein n=1 Tax=Dendropsophus ebraccatus TaxID=150705 RepID=UPI003831AD01
MMMHYAGDHTVADGLAGVDSFSSQMSQGSGDRPSVARKSTCKRKHLTCQSCNTPLPDGYEMTVCAACNAQEHPEGEQLSNSQMMTWMKQFVQDALGQFKESFVREEVREKLSSRRSSRDISPDSVCLDEFQVLDEVHSSPSDTDSDDDINFFPLEKMQKLFKLLDPEFCVTDEIEKKDGGIKKVRSFKVNDIIKRLMSHEWKSPEKGPFLNKRFKVMYPIENEQNKIWGDPPKVDIAVSRLFKRTVVPSEDGASFSDPMDRKIESAFRRGYLSASAQAKSSVSSYVIARNLRSWLRRMEEDIDGGTSRDELLKTFKSIALASDYLCDASIQQVRLAARAMSLSTAGRRALWIKPWGADVYSKNMLCSMEFKPNRVFGSELDTLMEGLSNKKGKSLPLSYSKGTNNSFRSSFSRKSNSGKKENSYSGRGRSSQRNLYQRQRGRGRGSTGTNRKNAF